LLTIKLTVGDHNLIVVLNGDVHRSRKWFAVYAMRIRRKLYPMPSSVRM
jgi:hypothetical protein